MSKGDLETDARHLALLCSVCAGVLLCLARSLAAGDSAQEPLFIEAAAECGLAFAHDNGATGRLLIAEIMGPGAALFDYDGDGDLDAYLVQGGPLPGAGASAEPFPRDRLYRNDLMIHPDGSRSARFTDVTDSAGIEDTGYGMGVAAGDYDNDGRVDLYVTNLGANRLLHNDGAGRFSDRTAQAGVGDLNWSSSAAFVDFDRDGWLDLFVVNYVEFAAADSPVCYGPSSAPDYCGPSAYRPAPDRLFRNRGDGTFEDRTAAAGIASPHGAGLGVVTGDFNADGWPDIFVANDGDQNHLWLNRGDGTFRDEALWAGVAVNRSGAAEAGMGVDAGDFDGDGDQDLFLTHLTGETDTLYVQQAPGLYEDRTAEVGLAAAGMRFTGFGTAWLDVDNDGWLDLLAVNGAVRLQSGLAVPAAKAAFDVQRPQVKGESRRSDETGSRRVQATSLGQPGQVFRNTGEARFVDVSEQAPALGVRAASRGAAFGDVDNDGDTDVLVMDNGAPARLLLGQAARRGHWVGVRLVDAAGRRDQFGARVEVQSPGQRPVVRFSRADGSYCSANDPRAVVGLGERASPVEVRVRWPDGRLETWPELAVDRYWTLRQGAAPRAE